MLYAFDGAPAIVLLEQHRTGAFVVEPNDIAGYTSAAEKLRLLA